MKKNPKQVTKNFNGINEVINYHYDFQGFKIMQTINRNDSVFKQHYVRDPQGSVLAIYTDTSATNYKKLTLSELSIYGSSRLGTIQLDSVLYKQNGNNIVTPTISNIYAQKLGLKLYELSNHLGNVTTVVSDRKFIQGNGQNAVFVADIVSVTDYYAYGIKITERSWGKDARYQYNGKEQDKGFGRYNFDGRMYDERSCRWMSLDPKAGKYVSFSPYSYTGGSPIAHIEIDGGYFIGIDGKEVKVGKAQDGKWVLSDNATDDLRRMVGLINNSKSPLAMRIFGIVANNKTKITFKFVEESISDKDLFGLHQPHDKSGKPLTWSKEQSKFIDGEPEFIDTKADRLEYKEATISIFLDNYTEQFIKGQSNDVYKKKISREELIVGYFSHESFHDIDQIVMDEILNNGKVQSDVEETTTLIEMSVVSEQVNKKGIPINEELIKSAYDEIENNEKNSPKK